MIKKLFASLLATLIIAPTLSAQLPADSCLRRMAARMLMVGFKNDSITPDNAVVGYLRDLKVGGIILFDVDLTGSRTLGSRNITTAPRLKQLTADLRALAEDYPLIIAADQEGGRVQRLKPRYGFKALPSAKEMGKMSLDSARAVAALMAEELAWAGVNLNLAPELDIHCDGCPVIGDLDRAFSSNPDHVAMYAEIVVDELRKKNILAALKHFPGHGSATSDSHYGLTDVTAQWKPEELKPFARLIANGNADFIMSAHIFNRHLDEDYPATLSHRILTDILRDSLGFEGVVLSDDMYMQGIIDNYEIADAVVRAINAGADMLIMGNNISTGFEADRPQKMVDLIVTAVKEGKIPVERIVEANRRIEKAAQKTTAKQSY